MLPEQAVHGGHGNRGEQHACKTHFLTDMGQQAEQHKHGQWHHHKLDGADDEGVFACGLNVGGRFRKSNVVLPPNELLTV